MIAALMAIGFLIAAAVLWAVLVMVVYAIVVHRALGR